ncbi:dipeptidase [Paraburkholderia sp. ZP32-5]|uniref:dipeptidase n=1 Tax=Paraburkholderia sp. ZP32-5 TaxID=2883245 RepID=UPI001F3A5174|nr:dipeptidase [Paraburkholderia sp. ZP32-5]
MSPDVEKLHADAIVIDATCPLLSEEPKHLELYRQGGFTAVAPTVPAKSSTSAEAILKFAMWRKLCRELDDLMMVLRADDIVEAKRSGKLGLIMHFQGTEPLDRSVDILDAYHALGLRVVQLTYNKRCHVGDGCEEEVDGGLSRFGKAVVRRLNELNIIVDVAHTGVRTSFDAIEHSSAPVILSHANARGVHSVPRNAGDDLYKAIAASGGVIGVVGFPAFVAKTKRPTLDQFIDHIAYIAEHIGIDHVGLGIDYYAGQAPICPDDVALALYERQVAVGNWTGESYPPPPYYYPEGIETPATMQALTAALVRRGFHEAEIRKILGENWLRVYRAVWG